MGVDQVRIVGRRNGIHRSGRMDEIEESRRPRIIPAHAKIERQPVGNLPVILDIDAELEILRIDDRAAVAGLGAELKAIWNIVVETTAGRERGVIGIEGIEVTELERVELNQIRTEERRVGNEGCSTGRLGWSPEH